MISDDGNTKKLKEIQHFTIGLAAADWSGIVGIPDDSILYTPVITDPMPDTVPDSEIVTVTTDSTGVIDAVPDVALVTVGTDSTAPMPAIATGVGKVPVVHPAMSRKDRRATGPAPVEG